MTAYMEFANGATGVFITTTADAPGTNRLEITGTKGRLICDENGLTYDRLKEDERIWCATCKEGFEKPGCERVEVETDGENPQHAGVLNAFAAHIQTGAPLVADGREGINGLMLSNAIHLSSWLARRSRCPSNEKKFLNLLNERRAHSRLKEDTDVVMDTASSYGGGANKMEKVKTAVIGIGNMGTAHAQSLWDNRVPGLALAAVCDTDPARLAYAAKAWPGVASYAGILISCLGAVMDVSVSITAALEEIRAKAPTLSLRELVRSGLTVGHDMIGTMSNTLILAYTGTATGTLLTLYAYEMPYIQMMSYNAIVIEIFKRPVRHDWRGLDRADSNAHYGVCHNTEKIRQNGRYKCCRGR